MNTNSFNGITRESFPPFAANDATSKRFSTLDNRHLLKPGSLWSGKSDDGFTAQIVKIRDADSYYVSYYYTSGRWYILPIELFLYIYSPAGEDIKWTPSVRPQPQQNWFYKMALRVQRFFSRTSPTR